MRKIKKIILISMFVYVNNSYSQDYFNPLFLGVDVDSIDDLSYLSAGNVIAPGNYHVSMNIGDSFIKEVNVQFKEEKNKKVVACFTKEIISLLPLKKEVKSKIENSYDNENKCVDINKYISDFNYDIDLSKLTLTLSIPQIYLNSIRSTLASESDWDDGVSVFMTNYNLNGSFSKNKETNDYSSLYLNLNNRLNIGAWRLRSNLYYNQNKVGSNSYHKWKSNSTVITRGFNSLRSQLTAGQSVLGSTLFDSNSYIGITLASATEMLPESERGYSPTIKGIAESRSKITIRQNGNILYQEYINPGPYSIDNLNSVGSSGDYEVELTSAEGIVTKYVVPYSSLPNLLRKGSYNYSLTLGELDISGTKRNRFNQGSFGIGLPLDTTAYVGYQIANDYFSTGFGIAKDIGSLGAVSVDTIQAQAKINNDSMYGSSYRILYAKAFNGTGTNIQLTGYRYSTSDYYTFSEANYRNSNLNDKLLFNNNVRRKNSFQVNISQSIGDYGQLYIWGNTNTYWDGDANSKNIQIGWNKTLKEFNDIMLSASYNKNTFSDISDDVFYLTISMPLSSSMSTDRMYLSNSTSYNNSKYNNQTSVYGNTLNDKLSYNFYQTISNEGKDSNERSNLNLRYKANITEFNVGTSYSRNFKELDYGATGALLIHQGGVIFSREANDTAILVEAKGASGARIDRAGESITISNNGYALIPYATAYHYNDISLSPDEVGMGYDIDGKVLRVAPTRGAISKVVFDVRKGYNFLVTLNHKGKPIKFGTSVINESEQKASIVNDDSTVYLTGVKPHSKYLIKLENNSTCNFIINYVNTSEMQKINKVNATCG